MKKIKIITNFSEMPSGLSNDRFNNIANMLNSDDYDIELITSSFSHVQKNQKENNSNFFGKYKFTTLHEPSYSKNISLKRLYSHHVFAENLYEYLSNTDKPDIIYCAIPSIDVGNAIRKYCNKNKVKYIVDIQDIWPDAFELIIKNELLSKILFYGMNKRINNVYKNASAIIAVSKTYLNRAIKYNSKALQKVIYLGTDLNAFDSYNSDEIIKKPNEILIVYIGTLGHSYNIKGMIDILDKIDNKNIKFKILGNGPLMKEFIEYSKSKKVDCEFLGRVPYKDMAAYIKKCDIAVNCINKGSAGSVINKICDYAAAGLPVINTQDNLEYISLVYDYNIGINCDLENEEDSVEKIKVLIENKVLRQIMGYNNRKMAEKLFDRSKTYEPIREIINESLN